MTKTTTGGERERKRGFLFSAKFTLEGKHKPLRNRVFSLPEVLQPPVRSLCWPETLAEETDEGKNQHSTPVRRHSWSAGINSCGIDYKDSARSSRKSSQDSRRGSSASIPEIIEECTSDDECLVESPDSPVNVTTSGVDLRCRNCFQKDPTTATVKNNKYPYCKTCRDLLRSKNNYGNMIPYFMNDIRKTNTTNEYISIPPPKRTRKTSLPECIDLPCIEEPGSGEEGSDTKELQLIVEKEVHKLLKFGSTGKKPLFYNNQRRRNSDNDLELISAGFKNMRIHKNADLIH